MSEEPLDLNSLKTGMDSALRKALPDFLSSDENADIISRQIEEILKNSLPNMVAESAQSGMAPQQAEDMLNQFGASPQESSQPQEDDAQSGAYEAAEPDEYGKEKNDEENAEDKDSTGEEQGNEKDEAGEPGQEEAAAEPENNPQEQEPQTEAPAAPDKNPQENPSSPEGETEEQPQTKEGDSLGFDKPTTEHPMYDEANAATNPEEKKDTKPDEQEREKKQAEALQQERNQARAQQTQNAQQGQQAANISSQKKQLLTNASRLTIKGLFALKAGYIVTDSIDVLESIDGATVSALFNIFTVATTASIFMAQNGETKKFILKKYALKACGAAIAESIPIVNIVPWDTINGFMLARAVKKQKKEYTEEAKRLESGNQTSS